MCRSVPQMDATFTFTSTSVRPNGGIFTSRTSAPGAASGFTTASIVVAMIATYGLRYENSCKRKTYDFSTAQRLARCAWIYSPPPPSPLQSDQDAENGNWRE